MDVFMPNLLTRTPPSNMLWPDYYTLHIRLRIMHSVGADHKVRGTGCHPAVETTSPT